MSKRSKENDDAELWIKEDPIPPYISMEES
jgi:hypothetical protein